jgi:hypothetical protein
MLNSKNRIMVFLSLIFGLLLVVGVYVYANYFNKSPDPNSVKISLSKAGVVADFKFEVRKNFPYWYSLKFGFPENDQTERARVRKLLGGHTVNKEGKPTEPGIPTPIQLTILALCKDGKEIVIYSQDADPILASWSDSDFGKNIGSHVLAPGTYRARIVNKRSSPELSSIPIAFEIGMPANISFNPSKEPIKREPCLQ